MESTDLHMNLSLRGANNTHNRSQTKIETFDEQKNLTVFFKLLIVFYITGIIGSFCAMLHLYRKKNFKNTKQAFMLK